MAKSTKKAERIPGLVAIDNHLKLLNLTRRWLAAKLEISEQALAGWWIRNKIPLERVGDVATVLGCDAGDLAPDLAVLFRVGWVREVPAHNARDLH